MSDSAQTHSESAYRILAIVVGAIVIGTGLQFVSLQGAESNLHVASVAAIPAAPVVGEVDAGMSERARQVAGAIEGMWIHVEDQTTVFEFAPGGIFREQRGDEEPVVRDGIWGVFTSDMAPEGEAVLPEGVAYLQTTVGEVATTFQIGSVAGMLQLVDISNGEVAHFQKI